MQGNKKPYVEITLGYGSASIKSGSSFSKVVSSGVNLLSIGIKPKWFITEDDSLMGVYFGGNIEYYDMSWTYKKPYPVNEEEKVVEHDSIRGTEISFGFGINLINQNNLQFGADLMMGVIGWDTRTMQKVKNDFIQTFDVVKVTVYVAFR